MTDNMFITAQSEAQAQLANANEWWSLVRDFQITNDEQQEQIAGVLRKVKEKSRELEDRRKEITGPMNQALRSVNDLFRQPKLRLDALEALLKEKIALFLRTRAEVNRQLIATAAVASTPQAASQSLAQVAPIAPPTGVTVRKVWKFAIDNPDAVPREFCSPDPDKIKLVDPATTHIPGVRFYQEDQVSSRR